MAQEQQSAEHRQATYFADTRSCDWIIVGSFVVIDDGLYKAHARHDWSVKPRSIK